MSLAFIASFGFLALHALATPDVLLGKNACFELATPVGLVVASAFAAASARELSAAHAALVMRRSLRHRNAPGGRGRGRAQPSRLVAVPVGGHSGEALAGIVGGSRGHRKHGVVGDAVNLAARLQTEAPVGQVVLGAETVRRLPPGAAFSGFPTSP
jgi:class 3 adenylate cyclase